MISPRISYLEFASETNKAFVAYRLPEDTNHYTLTLKEDKCKTFNKLTEITNTKGFIFTPFNTKQNPSLLLIPDEVFCNDKGFRGDLFLNKNIGKDISKLFNNKESKASYTTSFENLHNKLKSNKLKKIILSKTITVKDIDKTEQVYIYHNLTLNYPNAMVYWVHLPHLGINWLGATPETLVKKVGENLHTVALAGTKTQNEKWTNKERQEQQLVTDYIIDSISEFQYSKAPTTSTNTGVVEHLITPITIYNASEKINTIAEKLHPTPAICGLPKDIAFETILDTETHDREYYCGIVGILDIEGISQLFVNLRCMKMAENKAEIFVGGGLTASSDMQQEWEETERKADTLRRFL